MTDEDLKPTVAVKPLEWRAAPDWIDGDLVDNYGLYCISDCVLFIGHEETGIVFEGEDEAKAAAQADFDRRILSQITTQPVGVAEAARDVLAERRRQKDVEEWSEEHDDLHIDGSLSAAAACYAAWDISGEYNTRDRVLRDIWPWDWHWWKPKSKRENLVRAGALILADIERLDRAALRALTQQTEGEG